MKTTTLKELAAEGYLVGLATIGDVARHLAQQEDAFDETEETLAAIVKGHEHESIDMHLTLEDKRRMDDDEARADDAEGMTDEQRRQMPKPGEP